MTRQASQSWHHLIDKHPAGGERQLLALLELGAMSDLNP
jgi:hypothetical protein